MAVSSLDSTLPLYQSKDPFAPVGNKELNRDDFMKLFITQLQFQDPMEPMNSYEMASQLAQFSNMDATMKMADNMEQLLSYQTSQNNLQLLTLIDKNVQAYGNQMAVVNGAATPTEFALSSPAEVCVVNIYDAAGRLVDTVDLGYSEYGVHELTWDGKNPRGEQAPDGAYSYKVDALDAAGQKIEVEYRTTGKVTGLQFDSGQATVTVDDYIDLKVSDILTVK